MTTTTIDRVAALHALAAHVDQHDLAGDLSAIRFDGVDWTGIVVQVHLPATMAAWVRSLGDVEASGHRSGGNIHLWIVGAIGTFPLGLVLVLTPGRDLELVRLLSDQVAGTDCQAPVAIELPEILGGAA